jgi:hypothetical protein
VWDEVLPEAEPGVAWYCVEPDVERSSLCVVDARAALELEFELEELGDDDAVPATAMADPTPTKATTLEAETILRARPAGCRRRRRRAGVARSSGMRTSLDRLLTRSVKSTAVTALRDA